MYKETKALSFIIRYGVCYVTVAKYNIFANIIYNFMFSGVIYSILCALTYSTVKIFIVLFSEGDSTNKAIMYFIIYFPNFFCRRL